MNARSPEIYEFDNFRVDAVKRLLTTSSGEVLPLAPKAFETLLFLVRNSGRLLDKEEIMRAIWTDTIVEENNLNQSISAIRRVLGEKHDEHRFIVTVPGHGYKFVSEVRIQDDAKPLVENFNFENSNSKLPTKSTIEVSEREIVDNQKPKSAKLFWLTALAALSILAIGAAAFYFWRDRQTSASDAPVKSVAVLPFKSLVSEDRNEALEMGMADALISKLSGSEEITVRPLESVRRSAASGQDSLAIGRELGTEAVLDGSIQTSGERIRISARLLRTGDGKQLWAGQFDEKFTDIFALQDSISEKVAAALQTRLGTREKKPPTENIEAYQLYMKGRFHASRSTQAEIDKAVDYYRQAIEIDPNYALAYVGLSNAYRSLAVTSDQPSGEMMPKAKTAGQRAIELDETRAEAHVALAAIAFWYDWDWQTAERHYLRALELDPNNSNAHSAYAHYLSNTGQHEKALAEARRGRELDPLRLSGNALEAQFLHYAGKPDEALDRLQKTLDLDQNYWLAHLITSRVYTEKGMHREAIAAAEKARTLSKVNSESIALAGYSLAKAGETEKSRAVLDELQKLSAERYVPPYNLALVHNGLGNENAALGYLEKGLAEKDARMIFLKIEPKWNNLRAQPRFQNLMRRMNFPE